MIGMFGGHLTIVLKRANDVAPHVLHCPLHAVRLGAARDTLWIAELSDSMAERNRRAIWVAMNAPGEDAAISRDSLPLASRGFRMVERV